MEKRELTEVNNVISKFTDIDKENLKNKCYIKKDNYLFFFENNLLWNRKVEEKVIHAWNSIKINL